MNTGTGNTVEQLLLLVSDLRDEQGKVLQRINEVDLNNEKRLAAYDVQLKELQTDLEKTREEVKVLLSEKATRDKHDQERDRKIEELINDKNFLRDQIVFLQKQMPNVLTNALHSPTGTHQHSPQALDSSDKTLSHSKTDSRNTLPVQKTQSTLQFDSDANGTELDETANRSNGIKRQQRNKQERDSERQRPSIDSHAQKQARPRVPLSNSIQPNSTTHPRVSEPLSSEPSEKTPTFSVNADSALVKSDIKPLDVVKEESKEYFGSATVWVVEAEAEVVSASKTAVRTIEGAQTVLLIDTSASMAENGAWDQTRSFVNDYLTGLIQIETRYKLGLEYVSIVTFGSQTRCQQRFTKDYNLLKTVFASLKLGGPSPLYGGLYMALAATNCTDKSKLLLPNELLVGQKIILITDGFPTELRLHRGPDKPDPRQMDETTGALLSVVDRLHEHDIDLFCVPVGTSNTEFLNTLLLRETGRRILHFSDGHYFSRRLLLMAKLQRKWFLFGGIEYVIPERDPDIGARDLTHLQEIVAEVKVKLLHQRHREDRNPYTENDRNENLIPIGSRVRRGPDWNLKNQEDGNGPGTVVGQHPHADMVWVHWDQTSMIHIYYCGDLGRYDVLPVDEPRIPLPGQPLEVGCEVQTGKDWKDADVPRDMKGVVIQMAKTKQGISKAVVRWENGKRGAYSYGVDRVFEVQICLPGLEAASRSPAVPAIESHSSVTELVPFRQGRGKPLKAIEDVPSTSKTELPKPPISMKPKNKNKNT